MDLHGKALKHYYSFPAFVDMVSTCKKEMFCNSDRNTEMQPWTFHINLSLLTLSPPHSSKFSCINQRISTLPFLVLSNSIIFLGGRVLCVCARVCVCLCNLHKTESCHEEQVWEYLKNANKTCCMNVLFLLNWRHFL